MRASLLQISVDQDESVENRRARVAGMVQDVAGSTGARLVVLPELWPVGAFAFTAFAEHAEGTDGPTGRAMAVAAREAGVWLHAGSIVERDTVGTLYNTSLVFDPSGTLVRTYRKIHRFGFDRGEAVLMGAGDSVATVPLPDFTVGLATCYDLRFPELFRRLTYGGATAFAVPAGWPARRREHWTLLARARAVENQSYVLGCGTAGGHAGVEQTGHSLVVDPWGEVLAEAGTDEEVLTVDLDPDRVRRTRADFPALRDRVLDV